MRFTLYGLEFGPLVYLVITLPHTAYKAVLKSLPHARDERTGLGTRGSRELSGRDEESPFATVIYFFAMNSNLSGLPVCNARCLLNYKRK